MTNDLSEKIRWVYRKHADPLATYEDNIRALQPDHRANFERAGVVLQPKQILFVKAAREADNPAMPAEINVGGARGGGKSFTVMAQILCDDCIRVPGLKVLYLRQTAKAGKEQFQLLVRQIAHSLPCTIKATRIDFHNGSSVVIGGFKDDSQANSYQGNQYDLIVIEELTQLSEHTYTTLRASLRTGTFGWRVRGYNTFNPLGIGHLWCKKRFVDPYRGQAEPNGTIFIPSTVDDNAMVDEEYAAKLEEFTGAELRAFRYGEWDVLAGAYFEGWDYDIHTIPALDEISNYWRVWAAMDAGFQHWNMSYLFTQDTLGNVYIFHEWAHRKMHPGEIAPEIHNTLAVYGLKAHQLQFFCVGTDAFRLVAGQQVPLADQYKTYNLILQPADMSPGSRVNGWQLVSRLLGDPRNNKPNRLYITRNCTRLIETLPYLERDPNHPEDVKKWDTDEDGKGGDDAADALRYGLYMAMNSGMGNYEGQVTLEQYTTFQNPY